MINKQDHLTIIGKHRGTIDRKLESYSRTFRKPMQYSRFYIPTINLILSNVTIQSLVKIGILKDDRQT